MCKLDQIRKIINNKNFPSWPEGINFSYENNTLTLILTEEAVGVKEYIDKKNNEKYKGINMQDNSACFEGWAIGLKALNQNEDIKKICLKVNGNLPKFDEKFKEKDKKIKLSGHYGRFLYRALRFSEQYDWFSLEESLDRVVTNFKKEYLKEYLEDESVKKYLEDKSVILCNNVPDNEAGTNDKLECRVETKMAENKEVFLDCLQNADCPVKQNQEVYRQLPVGLFLKEVKEGNQVFTGGASAIDLWTMNGNVLQVVELKADNKMVGIITEIFFYSNYMYDLLINKTFRSTKPKFDNGEKENRGYDTLFDNDEIKPIEGIQGIMLADVYHPLITDEVVKVLNERNKKNKKNKKRKIKYFKAEYDFDVTIKQK